MGDLQIVPAAVAAASCKNVEAQFVEMMVPLYSYGCEKKVKKALSHIRDMIHVAGIYSVNVDYYQQKVTVWGICNKFDVLAITKTKRKDACFWPDSADAAQLDYSAAKESPPPPNYVSRPSFAPPIRLLRSLSWKSVKKVFTRSLSF